MSDRTVWIGKLACSCNNSRSPWPSVLIVQNEKICSLDKCVFCIDIWPRLSFCLRKVRRRRISMVVSMKVSWHIYYKLYICLISKFCVWIYNRFWNLFFGLEYISIFSFFSLHKISEHFDKTADWCSCVCYLIRRINGFLKATFIDNSEMVQFVEQRCDYIAYETEHFLSIQNLFYRIWSSFQTWSSFSMTLDDINFYLWLDDSTLSFRMLCWMYRNCTLIESCCVVI